MHHTALLQSRQRIQAQQMEQDAQLDKDMEELDRALSQQATDVEVPPPAAADGTKAQILQTSIQMANSEVPGAISSESVTSTQSKAAQALSATKSPSNPASLDDSASDFNPILVVLGISLFLGICFCFC